MSHAEQVRAAADIVGIVGDYVKLRKVGTRMVGLCPFHQEKTPSFSVSPTKQLFYCFGCGVGGDVFKFVMQIENLTFPEALRRVAEKVGVRLTESADDSTYDANARERAVLYKIHDVSAKFFAAQLTATVEGRLAKAYLADRGLSDETMARFRLGYAPSEGRALTRHLTAAGFSIDDLKKSGLVLQDAEGERSFDRFRRRVIFPIANDSGKVVAFGGRALGDEPAKYLNSPETPIYTKSRVLYNLDRAGMAIRKLDYAILVEGYMDCIAVASSGIENVVASCGTSLTDSQLRLLARYSRRAVMNYDPDSAGVAATERSLAMLLEEGFEAKVLALPSGLDPDSFIRKQGVGPYRERLAAAPSYFDYLTERATSQHDVTKPEGKVAAANVLLPYLAKIPSRLLRDELSQRVAERLRLDERLLRDELKRAASEGRKEMRAAEASQAIGASPAEKQLLRAFLASEELANEFLPKLVEEGDCVGLPTEGIFKQFLEFRRRGTKLEISALEDSFSTEEKRLLYDCAFASGEAADEKAVLGCCRALRRRRVERERQKLQNDIQVAARDHDQPRLAELLRAKAKLDGAWEALQKAVQSELTHLRKGVGSRPSKDGGNPSP
jgi:DNA primase